MNGDEWLTTQFERNRPHLRAVAYRVLGSAAEADDAVQETWLRLRGTDPTEVRNPAGWLTTVVSRVCLNMLRSRRTRGEEPLDERSPQPETGPAGTDPEAEAVLADSVGAALLVVLDTLAPAERLAFVLHDMFAVSFDEVAEALDRTPEAARQLASRARRRVRGSAPESDPARQREIVDAFLAASRAGDFDRLLAILDPDVVVRADGRAVELGAAETLRGAAAVAGGFARRARGARPARLDGAAGLAWVTRREVAVVFQFTIKEGRVAAIDLIGDPVRLAEIDLAILTGRTANPAS